MVITGVTHYGIQPDPELRHRLLPNLQTTISFILNFSWYNWLEKRFLGFSRQPNSGKENFSDQIRGSMADTVSAPPRSATDLFSDSVDGHPLWFKPELFLSPNFDSESYISELRTFVPFDTLRSELQSHLSSLNHELIDLINRDYADFVNLSTKLVDVDAAVVRMRAPLLELREKIEQFRGSVEAALVALKNGLKQRSDAASAREVLELLLDTFHVVSKVRKNYLFWLNLRVWLFKLPYRFFNFAILV